MFYMRTYLKIEGGKRQGEKSKIDLGVTKTGWFQGVPLGRGGCS